MQTTWYGDKALPNRFYGKSENSETWKKHWCRFCWKYFICYIHLYCYIHYNLILICIYKYIFLFYLWKNVGSRHIWSAQISRNQGDPNVMYCLIQHALPLITKLIITKVVITKVGTHALGHIHCVHKYIFIALHLYDTHNIYIYNIYIYIYIYIDR